MLQDVVGYADQCIFFAVHASVFADDGQTVYVGVYYESYIVLAGFHQVHDVAQVLLQRFGVVLEVACRLAIEFFNVLHAQCFEQLGQDDTAHGVHTVDGYVEVSLADSLYIHQVESQHAINMLLVISQVFAVSSKFVNFGVFESLGLGYAEHLVAFFLVQEFTLFVQQFQGIPLTGIV